MKLSGYRGSGTLDTCVFGSGWSKYAHARVGMTTFGASAPGKDLAKKFGFTVDHVLQTAKDVLAFYKTRPVPELVDRLGA